MNDLQPNFVPALSRIHIDHLSFLKNLVFKDLSYTVGVSTLGTRRSVIPNCVYTMSIILSS